MTTRVIIVGCLGALMLAAGCTQTDDGTIAAVDGEKIQTEEFRLRYSSYLEMSGVRDNIVARGSVLSNMINEVVILKEIERQGWKKKPEIRKRLQEIETQALLDAYAKRVADKFVIVSEAELWEEFRHANTRVSARYVYAPTEEGAWKLRRRLQAGTSFVSLAREVFDDPGLAHNGGYVGYFGKGDMEDAFEDVAFSLPVGSLSDPVKLGLGYAVIKVEDRKYILLASEQDYAAKKEKLEQDVRKRKTKEVVEKTALEIGDALALRFSEPELKDLFAVWNSLGQAPEVPDGTRGLVSFGSVHWSINDVLDKAEWTTPKQRGRVKTPEDLKKLVTGLAARDVLVERARNEGLNALPEVIRQKENVTNSYLLKQWANEVQASSEKEAVPESVARGLYEKNQQTYFIPPEVNVAEILVRTMQEAGTIMEKIKKGASFSDLARRNSLRSWAARQGGELGYGPKSKYGVLGDQMLAARLSAVIGPVRVDPYVGIFKIIGRREGRPKSFEEAKDEIIHSILSERKSGSIRAEVNRLRARASVTINEKALEFVQVESQALTKEKAP